MDFKIYDNGQDFLTEAEGLIEKKEALNNLIYAIAESNLSANSENNNHPLFLTIKDDNRVEFAAVMTPPKRMVIYSDIIREDCFQFAIDNLTKDRIELPGVLGPNECAMKFAEILKQEYGKIYEIAMKERVYQTSRVNELSLAKGQFRVANEEDLPTLQKWTTEFMKEALSASDTDDAIERFVRKKIETKSIFVWANEQLVSMAAKTRPTKRCISINLVYTPDKFRKKGYARSCVARLTETLLAEEYKYCTLFTDLLNPTSNKIYQEIGYREVGDILAVDFKKN